MKKRVYSSKEQALEERKIIESELEKCRETAKRSPYESYMVASGINGGAMPGYLMPYVHEFLEIAAEGGEPHAMFALASCFRWGIGGVFVNYEKALFWSKKAAEAGLSEGERLYRELSNANEQRVVISACSPGGKMGSAWIRAKELVDIYYKRAEAGDLDCMFELGYQLSAQTNIGPFHYDIDKALMYLEKAAQSKHITATVMLGKLYYYGSNPPMGYVGLDPDKDKAREYFMLGESMGNKECSELLKELY